MQPSIQISTFGTYIALTAGNIVFEIATPNEIDGDFELAKLPPCTIEHKVTTCGVEYPIVCSFLMVLDLGSHQQMPRYSDQPQTWYVPWICFVSDRTHLKLAQKIKDRTSLVPPPTRRYPRHTLFLK